MRVPHLLVGCLALLLGACSGSDGRAPPPLNKQLLAGKWKNVSEAQFIAGYEFAEDGTVKMTLQGMGRPVQGRYAWSGERTLDLEYQAAPDVQQAYQAAARAYKDQLTDSIKAGKLYDRAGESMSAAVPDELPAKETVQVGLSEQPRLLILINASAVSQTFETTAR
jgi:hypothetical protein